MALSCKLQKIRKVKKHGLVEKSKILRDTRERETEKMRDREKERQRKRETERKRERETERKRKTQSFREKCMLKREMETEKGERNV